MLSASQKCQLLEFAAYLALFNHFSGKGMGKLYCVDYALSFADSRDPEIMEVA
jgi:hypothetical protein